DPTVGGPYVMWGDTPYAQIMVLWLIWNKLAKSTAAQSHCGAATSINDITPRGTAQHEKPRAQLVFTQYFNSQCINDSSLIDRNLDLLVG
ncbi:MAG: hypothetical protein V7739_22195, partial [Motiliproteus sp.]